MLIQARACGCPVVSTDCPSGPAEILEGGALGPLVPVGAPDALADAMLRVLEAPPDRERLRRRADDFSVDRVAGRYLAVMLGSARERGRRASAVCGICGFPVRGEGFPAAELEPTVSRMADTLRHRGPDSSGSWVDAGAGIALGHRRLAIVDLTPDGAQPMVSACGRYVIAFNGEIYNFRELRKELEGEGVRFRGRSDTEVLLEAIARWGTPQALRRANGMLAFAVWDRRERVLTLARDPLGKKPLYWWRIGDTILFGSELKALRAHPRFRAEIDRDRALTTRPWKAPVLYGV